jgi:hypothetical protein
LIERRSVLVITYPCDLYRPGSAELSRVVAVVPLVDETKRGAGVWRGMYDHCPLPRRAADARVQAGNLQVPSTVDGRYLVPRHRVCSLSACGMAFLHQRLVLARSRVITPLEVHEFHLEPVEHERWLWEGWVMSGGDANGYQAWLNTPLPRAGGVVPRLWLDNRQFSFLDGEARRHLQTLGLSPTF